MDRDRRALSAALAAVPVTFLAVFFAWPLLATIARFGEDGWQDYWKQLADNGLKVTSGWSDAYEVDFTAGGGGGDRPIVVSYASSPPFTVPEGGELA